MPLNKRKVSKPASATSRTKANQQAKKTDDSTFTEKLIKKEHTVISMKEIEQMVNRHIVDIRLDPLEDLMNGMAKEENPIAQVHKTAWNLCRLLLLQAVSRMGSRSPTNARGLPVFPLTDAEVALYNKLTQTVINSKNTMVNMKKQRMAEDMMRQEDTINVTPIVYSEADVEKLIEIASKKDSENE